MFEELTTLHCRLHPSSLGRAKARGGQGGETEELDPTPGVFAQVDLRDRVVVEVVVGNHDEGPRAVEGVVVVVDGVIFKLLLQGGLLVPAEEGLLEANDV